MYLSFSKLITEIDFSQPIRLVQVNSKEGDWTKNGRNLKQHSFYLSSSWIRKFFAMQLLRSIIHESQDGKVHI